ncbi:MAG: zf-HC2 domain-containing protein [Desulfobacteraceae bacterium]|nr:zf-HC2 domain-containing protein [Desulfobacteraceae bacterium]
METCRNIRKKLSAYQDRELGPAEKDAIEAHLRICEACRKEHEALLQTYRILRSLPEIEATPGFSRQIVEKATQRQEPEWIRALGAAFRLLPAPTAMVTLAIVGLLTGALLGNFLTARQFDPLPPFSASHTDKALTLASVQVFDATPPGSFAGGYLRLATYTRETRHEK